MKKHVIITIHADGSIRAWSTFRILCDTMLWPYDAERRKPLSDTPRVIDGVTVVKTEIQSPSKSST